MATLPTVISVKSNIFEVRIRAQFVYYSKTKIKTIFSLLEPFFVLLSVQPEQEFAFKILEMNKKRLYRTKEFVWAKLTGFSYWPAIIMPPNPSAPPPPKENMYWVYFFGSNNYAWIRERYIKPYQQYKEKYTEKCTNALKDAHRELKWNRKKLAQNPHYQMDIAPFVPKEKKPRPKSSMSVKSTSTVRSRKKRQRHDSEVSSVSTMSRSYRSRSTRPPDFDEMLLQDFDITEKYVGVFACNLNAEAMVKNMLQFRHNVLVWSTSEALCAELRTYAREINARCQICSTPREVVSRSSIIFSMLSHSHEVSQVLASMGCLDVNDHLLKGKVYVEMTALDSEESDELNTFFQQKNAIYVEAMVQGTKQEAEDRQLLILIGASESSVPLIGGEYKSCFRSMGSAAYRVGEVGVPPRINGLLQSVKASILAGFCEVAALAKDVVDMNVFLDIFQLTSMDCPYLQRVCDNVRRNNYTDVQESIPSMQEDVQRTLKTANRLRESVPLTSTANQLFKLARRVGLEDKDTTSMFLSSRLSALC